MSWHALKPQSTVPLFQVTTQKAFYPSPTIFRPPSAQTGLDYYINVEYILVHQQAETGGTFAYSSFHRLSLPVPINTTRIKSLFQSCNPEQLQCRTRPLVTLIFREPVARQPFAHQGKQCICPAQ